MHCSCVLQYIVIVHCLLLIVVVVVVDKYQIQQVSIVRMTHYYH